MNRRSSFRHEFVVCGFRKKSKLGVVTLCVEAMIHGLNAEDRECVPWHFEFIRHRVGVYEHHWWYKFLPCNI